MVRKADFQSDNASSILVGRTILMKTCIKCKKSKPLTEFRKDSNRSDGYRSDCKECARTYQNSAYTQKYGEKTRKRTEERRNAHRQHIQDLKSKLGCQTCKEWDPYCLEFHHPDPNVKEFGIGNNITNSLETLLSEIEKCICLCSNCHKKVHAGSLVLIGVPQ